MGSPRDRHDDRGREKVQCRECKGWYHRLDVHLNSKHKLSVKQYLKKNPGAPTISEAAREKAAAAQGGKFKGGKGAAVKAPPADTTNDDSLFKFGAARLPKRDDLTDLDKLHIPLHDEGWIPGAVEQKQLEELALGIEDGDNVLIVGPPGIGKTTLAVELAAIVGQPIREVGMDGDMRRADFVGEKNVVVDEKSGHTVTDWVDGLLPDAAERGHWMLINEIDAIPPSIGFVLHGTLEKRRHLELTGDRGRPVKFHKDFRIIATANTLGHGDDSGMYAGTNVMNEALLDRFGVVIRADYPARATEIRILTGRTGIDETVAKKMRSVAEKIREAHKNETCFTSLSPRRLIDWAHKTVRMNDVRRAAKLTIVNKLADDDAKFVDNIIQRYFGGDVS